MPVTSTVSAWIFNNSSFERVKQYKYLGTTATIQNSIQEEIKEQDLSRRAAARLLRSWVRIPPAAWIFVCRECRVLSGRGLCDELITRPEWSYRPCCVVVCDLETSRISAPYIYNISSLRVKAPEFLDTRHMKVVRSSPLHTGCLYPQEYPGTHF